MAVTPTLNALLIAAGFTAFVVSFWNRNDLPGGIDPVADLGKAPVQTRSDREPFDVRFNGVAYRVEPQFEYDITGLVVSYRHHDDSSRMHRLANDHLNMLDVCVIWGGNPGNEWLHEFDFWNGIFTCNVSTRSREAWESFAMDELSNNHLISDDEFIRKQVRKISVGDQIRVRGYLASYSSEGGSRRGTSTTRTDTGDGACETIYVDDFRILRAATSAWRISMWLSLALLAAGLLLHFSRPYRPH